METKTPSRFAAAFEIARTVAASVSSYPYSPPDITANCIAEDLEDELAENLAILRSIADFTK